MTLSARSPRTPEPSAGALCQPSLPASICSEACDLDSLSFGKRASLTGLHSGPDTPVPLSSATLHPAFTVFPLPVTLPSLSTGLPVASSFSSLTASLFVTRRGGECAGMQGGCWVRAVRISALASSLSSFVTLREGLLSLCLNVPIREMDLM